MAHQRATDSGRDLGSVCPVALIFMACGAAFVAKFLFIGLSFDVTKYPAQRVAVSATIAVTAMLTGDSGSGGPQ